MKPFLTQQWQALWLGVGLLTRIPAPSLANAGNLAPGISLHWYFAVGLLIGLVLLALAHGFSALPFLAAALVVAAWTWLTGGLHLDGLADCADAWTGGMGDRMRTLAIMKDPACGPMGVAVVVLALLLKFAALTTLLSFAVATPWWLVPMLARAALPLVFISTPYVRPGGMGDRMAATCSPGFIYTSTVLTILIVLMFTPLSLGLLWLSTTLLVLLGWRHAIMARLGGFTGDGAGALVEILETALLVVAAAAVAEAP
ncbi:MAG: adenosylcobinamide-GDP ribazoletransferase [Porticoccaceae bacterium]|nr:adenosylcobinamide-GDP ribazoletransferase [Porticoccaceae bacterium]